VQPALFQDASSPVIRFAVAGEPVPQGSKVGQIVGRRIKIHGAVAVLQPKVLLTEQADMSTKTKGRDRLKKWRGRIETAAARAMQDLALGSPFTFDVVLSAEFVLPRPPSHYKPNGDLTASAKRERAHPGKPDLSKLVRAVEDAMSGIVYGDDAQVQRYGAVFKRYAERGGRGGVIVEVKRVWSTSENTTDTCIP
jgi:Holliday junction resolvase RusA-like endonuclease